MSLRTLTLLAMVCAVAVVLASCGGGQTGGSQGGDGQQAERTERGGDKSQRETRELEGRVEKVNPENRRIVVRPEGEDPASFTLKTEGERPTDITLDGNEASLEDIEKGQQARVEYRVVTNEKNRERNIALSVELTPARGGGTGIEETTGS